MKTVIFWKGTSQSGNNYIGINVVENGLVGDKAHFIKVIDDAKFEEFKVGDELTISEKLLS